MQVDLSHHTLVRWKDTDPKFVSLLKEAGITAVVAPPAEPFHKACAEARIEVIPEADLQVLSLDDGAKAKADRPVVFKAGLWPGVQRPDPQSAGATHSLWMDQNCWLVNFLRARYPKTGAVLGYAPDQDGGVKPTQMVAYDALELALVDSWVSGGNYLMSLHPSLREALLKGEAKALDAWRKLGRTAGWLRENEALYRQPMLPIVTVLVGGDLSQEIASLSFRQNVSPSLVDAAAPPAPDPSKCKLLVAVGLESPSAEVRRKVLAHAEAGATVVVDGKSDKAWWRVAGLQASRTDPDRNYFTLGKGQVAAYKEDIEDPGMVALDIIDILTQKQRPARVWNCNAGIVMAASGPKPGTGLLHVINYARMQDLPILARIQGRFQKATLLRPGAQPSELKVGPRGTGSEVEIPGLDRMATVVFS